MSKVNLFLVMLMLMLSCNVKKQNASLQKAEQSLKYLAYSWDMWASVWKPKPYDKESEAYKDLIKLFDALSPAEQDSLLKNELSLRRRTIDRSNIPGASNAALVPGEIQFCMSMDNSSEASKKAFFEYYPAFFEKIKEVTIFLTFYIIKKDSIDNSIVNREKIDQQINILNEAFKEIKIKFKIKKQVVIFNNDLYEKHPIKERLGDSVIRDSDNSIPIIINGYKKLIGNAPFPWGYEYHTTKDFIFISEGTLPGNSIVLSDGRNRLMEGKVLIHEIGHYFGLYHIFHQLNSDSLHCTNQNYGNCYEIGDRVADTPRQKLCFFESGFCNVKTNKECLSDSPQEGCIPCKTCDGETLMVDNFMGYNIDAVRKKFTKGQLLRMLTHVYYGDRYYLIADNIKI